MRRLVALLAVLSLAAALSIGEAESGAWVHRCLYDSLDMSDVTTVGAADSTDTVLVYEWRTSPGGKVHILMKEEGITTTGDEAQYNLKFTLPLKDGTHSALYQAKWYEGTTAKSAAVDLLNSDFISIEVMEPSALFFPDAGKSYYARLYLIIDQLDADAGYLSVWSWIRQDD